MRHGPRFGLAVHAQVGNAIELIAEVDARGADRREVAGSRSRRIDQLGRNAQRVVRHLTEVEESDSTDLAEQRLANLRRTFEHRQTADRQTKPAQRAHLVAAPPADARRAAEEIALEE